MDYDTDVNLVFKYYLSRQVNTAVVINENCKNSIDFYLLIAFLWMPKQYGYMAKIQKFKFTFWLLKHKKLTIKVVYCKSAPLRSDSLAEVFVYWMQLILSLPAVQSPLIGSSIHRVIDNLLDFL